MDYVQMYVCEPSNWTEISKLQPTTIVLDRKYLRLYNIILDIQFTRFRPKSPYEVGLRWPCTVKSLVPGLFSNKVIKNGLFLIRLI